MYYYHVDQPVLAELLNKDISEELYAREKTERALRLKGVEFHGSGSFDPNGLAVFDQGQGDFGEIPTIQFLDWDKNIIAEVSFQKIG